MLKHNEKKDKGSGALRRAACGLFLIAGMLSACFSLASCASIPSDGVEVTNSAAAPVSSASASRSETPIPDSLEYTRDASAYFEMIETLCVTVDGAITRHNESVESKDPQGFSDAPDYLAVIYAPFVSGNMQAVPRLGSAQDREIAVKHYTDAGYYDVELSDAGDGGFRISYKDQDETGEVISVEDLMTSTGDALRYERRLNGTTVEFFEFVSLGGDRYALQSRSDRALITYRGGRVVELVHAENIFEEDEEGNGRLTDWSVAYDPAADSILDKTDLDRAWVLEKQASGGVLRVYEIENGRLRISGLRQTGDDEERTFVPLDGIEIAL